MKKYPFIGGVFLLFLLCLPLLSGCERQPLIRSDFLFNTVVTIKLYEGGNDAVLDEAFAYLRELDGELSSHSAASPLTQLNAESAQQSAAENTASGTADAGVSRSLPAETAALLSRALELSQLTCGAYDPALGAVTSLYTFGEGAAPPDPAAVSRALVHTGADHVTVSGERVTLTGGVQLDLGGIAKGYASGEVADLLAARGVMSAIVDLGGNIVTVGQKNPPFESGCGSPSPRTARSPAPSPRSFARWSPPVCTSAASPTRGCSITPSSIRRPACPSKTA